MSAEKSIEITVQSGVDKVLGNILFDYEASYELMTEAGFTPEASRALPTHFDMDLPCHKLWKMLNNSTVGIYRHSAKDIHLNSRLIAKLHDKRSKREALCNRTWLHEVGHALDDFNGGLDPIRYPRAKLTAMLGYLAAASTAPAAEEYYKNINALYWAPSGLGGMLAAMMLAGAGIAVFDKKQLSASGKNEAFANQFEEEMYEKYQKIIQLT